jgi:hypothetical protein
VASTHAIDETVFVGVGARVLRPLRDARQVRSGERRPIWRSAELGQQTVAVTMLAASPGYGEDHAVFAASNAGVFVSRNGGESFEPWNTGLNPARMVSVGVSPSYPHDGLVYGLGLGGGIWRRRDQRR